MSTLSDIGQKLGTKLEQNHVVLVEMASILLLEHAIQNKHQLVLSEFYCLSHDSLRVIVTGLTAQSGKWYHLGLTGVARSTLSDANNKRDWHIFEGLFYHLRARCKSLTPKHKFQFKNQIYSLDSTTISLCLAQCPWAKFRTTKGALKMHRLQGSGMGKANRGTIKDKYVFVVQGYLLTTPVILLIHCFTTASTIC